MTTPTTTTVDQVLTLLDGELRRVLALADAAQRDAQCGPALMLLCGELRHATRTYIALQRQNATAVESFVHLSVHHQFPQCTQAYTTMYVRVYEAMERAKRARGLNPIFARSSEGESGRAPIKQSSVPLDPQSALSVVDCADSGSVCVTMHNDNEAVLKFPPSALYRVPHIEQAVQSLELYYDEQCDAIHLEYLGLLDAIRQQHVAQDCMTTSLGDIVDRIQLAVAALPAASEATTAMAQAAQQLKEPVARLNQLLGAQRANCETYADNVHAKFMVAVQLKDNMLRPYNLTRLHQQSDAIGSIF